MANEMFEVKVSNSVRNQTQNIPGKFGSFSGSTFTEADCAAGTLCVRNSLIPSEGYENLKDAQGNTVSILNGNTWYMVAATNGTSAGTYGDHTGIYAFNNYDVQKVGSGDNKYNIGAKTLGLGLPAGERGDFCELIVGEQYEWGVGNFTAAPTATNKYCTISGGKLTPSSSVPAGGTGVYVEFLRSEHKNEGTSYWGEGYICIVRRTAEVAVSSII